MKLGNTSKKSYPSSLERACSPGSELTATPLLTNTCLQPSAAVPKGSQQPNTLRQLPSLFLIKAYPIISVLVPLQSKSNVCIQTWAAQSCWAGVCHSNIPHRWLLQGAELQQGKLQVCKGSFKFRNPQIISHLEYLCILPNTHTKDFQVLWLPFNSNAFASIFRYWMEKSFLSGSWWLHSSPDLPTAFQHQHHASVFITHTGPADTDLPRCCW